MLLYERKRLTSWFLYVVYEFKNKTQYSVINIIIPIHMAIIISTLDKLFNIKTAHDEIFNRSNLTTSI